MTLLKWLWAGKIPEPKHNVIGGQDVLPQMFYSC
jgi:hypothetical protein